MIKAYIKANENPPVTTPNNLDDSISGRFLSIELRIDGIFKSKPKGPFAKKNAKKGMSNKRFSRKFRIASIYTSYDAQEQENLQDFLLTKLTFCEKNVTTIIGQDSNTQVGISKKSESLREENKPHDTTTGPFGNPKRNDKGHKLRNFASLTNLLFVNTFFQHSNYDTWKSFKDGTKVQIDHFMISTESAHLLKNCQTTNIGTVSDHTSLLLELHIEHPSSKKEKPRDFVNWEKLTKKRWKETFNCTVATELYSFSEQNDRPPSFVDFNNILKTVAERCLLEKMEINTGWFKHSIDLLQPLLSTRNELLYKARKSKDNCPILKQQCVNAKKNVKDAIHVAKGRWVSKEIGKMKFSPKKAWENIYTLKKGFQGHHRDHLSLNFKMPNGSLSASTDEILETLTPHFYNVYNKNRPFDPKAINDIPQRPFVDNLDRDILYSDFNLALKKLTWHKSGGLNHISPNALKALSTEHKMILFGYVKKWWDDPNVDYDDWHNATLVPLPKKGDTSNPNNWRGVVLMEVTSKIVASIINTRLQVLLKKYGTPSQFGGTPHTGCQDAVFSIRTLLQERREKQKDTWCIFVDLVKAYDTIKHEVINETLKKFGCSKHLRSLVDKLYNNFNVKKSVNLLAV